MVIEVIDLVNILKSIVLHLEPNWPKVDAIKVSLHLGHFRNSINPVITDLVATNLANLNFKWIRLPLDD